MKTLKWYLENQAGLTPEPRLPITQAEAEIKEAILVEVNEDKIFDIIFNRQWFLLYNHSELAKGQTKKLVHALSQADIIKWRE